MTLGSGPWSKMKDESALAEILIKFYALGL